MRSRTSRSNLLQWIQISEWWVTFSFGFFFLLYRFLRYKIQLINLFINLPTIYTYHYVRMHGWTGACKRHVSVYDSAYVHKSIFLQTLEAFALRKSHLPTIAMTSQEICEIRSFIFATWYSINSLPWW